MFSPAGTRRVKFRLLIHPSVKVGAVVSVPSARRSDLHHRYETGDETVEGAFGHAQVCGGRRSREKARRHCLLRRTAAEGNL